jgi:hypothetical protein
VPELRHLAAWIVEVRAHKSALEIRGVPEDLPVRDGLDIQEIMRGLKVWRNPVNRFAVARLHYSADPKKDTDEWRDRTRASYRWQEWLQEYEIVDSAFDGLPVYGEDFSLDFHVSKEPLKWNDMFPVVRGWDFGLAAEGMACVFVQLLPPTRLFVYNELTASDLDLEHFCPEVRRVSHEWFPNCRKWFDIVDPSGFNRNDIDKRKRVDIVRQILNTRAIPGAKSEVDRLRAVTRFLRENRRGMPAVMIDPKVRMLIDGFIGGYHYAWAKGGGLKDHPEKNEYSHIQDALQYVCSKILNLDINQTRPTVKIPTPKYFFNHPTQASNHV